MELNGLQRVLSSLISDIIWQTMIDTYCGHTFEDWKDHQCDMLSQSCKDVSIPSSLAVKETRVAPLSAPRVPESFPVGRDLCFL